MSLVITSKTAVFKNFVDSIPLDIEGLKVHLKMGGSIEESRTNRVDGSKLNVLGSPTIKSNSAIVSGADGFTTEGLSSGVLAEHRERTYILVARFSDLSAYFGHGSYDTTGSYSYFQDNSLALVYYSGSIGMQYASDIKAKVSENNKDKVYFVAVAVTNSGDFKTIVKSADVDKSNTQKQTITTTNNIPLFLGGHSRSSDSLAHSFEAVEAMYFDRVLSDNAINALYARLKNSLGKHNIAI